MPAALVSAPSRSARVAVLPSGQVVRSTSSRGVTLYGQLSVRQRRQKAGSMRSHTGETFAFARLTFGLALAALC